MAHSFFAAIGTGCYLTERTDCYWTEQTGCYWTELGTVEDY
jgi:hypothetical protein